MKDISKYIKRINIGKYEINSNVFLAPMAGVTDLPFRYICNKYGGVTYGVSEMVSSKGIIYNDKKTHKIMDMYEGEFPKVIQLFGSDEETLKETVLRLNKNPDIDIIDINMGCPAPKIVKNGDGAELLKDLNKVESIIKAVMSVTTKTVTLKTRAGYYIGRPTALEVAKMCEKYGVSAITVHGRYKEQKFSGVPDYDVIRLVKETVSIPVIANGDVASIESAIDVFDKTNADAIMIGRAAMGNPWIFKSIIGGTIYIPSLEERKQVILEHIDMATARGREQVEVQKLRKHLAWYLKGLKNSSLLRDKINTTKTKQELVSSITEYFDEQIGSEIND